MALWLAALVAVPVLAGCVDDDEPEPADPIDLEGRSAVAPWTYSVFPGDYRGEDDLSWPLVDGPYTMLDGERVVLQSDLDGVDIDFTIWRPDVPGGERVPVVIQASPYFSDSASLSGSLDDLMVNKIGPHGYAYVKLSIRSTGQSGGCDDFRGPNMVADIDQAVTHLAGLDWSNGNVSLIGLSYPGGTPWYAASTGNPAIKTIVPMSGTLHAWEVYNRNGTPESRAAIIVPNYGVGAISNTQRGPEHKVENFVCEDVYIAWAAGVSSGATGEKLPADFWDGRNAKPDILANYEGSVFVVHGFDDWNVDPAVVLPFSDQLNRTGNPVKHLIGQWVHTYPDTASDVTKRWDWAEILLRWFDHWLKGKDVDTGPPTQVQDSLMRWRDELHWPPHDLDWQTYNLSGDLSLTAGDAAPGSWVLAHPAVPLPTGPVPPQLASLSVLDFELPVEEELVISGLPRVHVTVTPTGPGGTLGAFLYEKEADGSLHRLGWTAMNLRFADGTETPQNVVPGEPIVARMEIQPMEGVVQAGNSLVLRLWINVPSDRILPPPATPIQIDVGGGQHAVLHLPVAHRAESAYFEAPVPTTIE